MKPKSLEARAAELLKATRATVAKSDSWQQAHNAIFGVGALFSELFPTAADRLAFSKSAENQQIRDLIESLPGTQKSTDVNGKILARVPKSLHAALLHEAETEGVSLNQLVVAKLSAQLRDVAHV